MYSPPLGRRLVPWIFAMLFMVVAPLLVLYTSGYRWNDKKGKVERNGTVILESRPKGATIFIDGREASDVTPITLQNMAPGRYMIRLEYAGYYSWEKELDVRAGYVTFANDIQLWKSGIAERIDTRQVDALEVSPDEQTLAMSVRVGTSTSIVLRSLEDDGSRVSDLEDAGGNTPLLEWSKNSRALLVQSETLNGTRTWLLPDDASRIAAMAFGMYRWNGSSLLGPTSATSSREVFDTMELTQSATGTPTLLNIQIPSRGLLLPSGSWQIIDVQNTGVVLRDGNHWLNVHEREAPPEMHRAEGDRLRSDGARDPSYLLVNGGEVWRWKPREDPELLWRESRPIVNARWHSDGKNVFIATEHEVFTLQLDTRSSHPRTTLVTFDMIYDMAFAQGAVYVAGRQKEEEGLWRVEVE